jgi:hypothetical protein
MRKILFICFIFAAYALAGQDVRPVSDYITGRFKDASGQELVKIIVPGKPPDHFRMPPADMSRATSSLANVPAYDWSFGCSATSASMMAGYYDRTGYSNMYSGPTNGGIAPMDNSSWGTVVINGETRSQCPISATRNGVDGRSTRGHVDDYWIMYGNTGSDPFIVNGWTEHTYSDCTGDFMKTNQSNYGNSDGSTTFWNYTNGAPYSGNYSNNDGMYGIKLFFESRGYTVTNYYNQYIYGFGGNTLGFTFTQYKAEIDAGRPVLIQVSGHTMLGMGYNDTGNLVYLHDTWDYSTHQMVWGDYYAGMQHYGVGVIQLQAVIPSTRTLQNVTVTNGQTVCYDATQTITLAGSSTTFTIQSGGNVTLISGGNILMMPGTLSQSGSHLLAGITTTGNYCGSQQSAMVSNPPAEEETISQEKLVDEGFLLYPNPTTGRFTLILDAVADVACYLQVTGMLGNRVIDEKLQGASFFSFDLSDQPAGIYLVRLVRGTKVDTGKLIIK